MTMPENYPPCTPYLSIKGAARAVEFYKKAFNAVERMRIDSPDGLLGHTELLIGNALIMLADEWPGADYVQSPAGLGGTTVGLHVYVPDVDAFVSRAVEAGATLVTPVEDKFYGDRTGVLRDPFEHIWYIATQIEKLTPDETMERARRCFEPAAPSV